MFKFAVCVLFLISIPVMAADDLSRVERRIDNLERTIETKMDQILRRLDDSQNSGPLMRICRCIETGQTDSGRGWVPHYGLYVELFNNQGNRVKQIGLITGDALSVTECREQRQMHPTCKN